MTVVFGFIFGILYVLSCFFCGFSLLKALKIKQKGLLLIVSSLCIGIFVTVFVDYVLAVMFGFVGIKTALSSYLMIVIGIILFFFWFRQNISWILKVKRIPVIESSVVLFVLFLSFYIMTKSFHYGTAGDWLVGSNEVFDFGHFLSILRSFSYGDNIPYSSPFVAGTPDMYHFMFYYFAALLERFGIPIVHAVNIPSILGFSLFLISIYLLAIFVSGNKFVGIISILLTVMQSSFSFFAYVFTHGLSLQTIKGIWQLAQYPYNGINDGSVFSIFFTLNVFVNQRHYAFALAVIIALFLLISSKEEKKLTKMSTGKIIFLGVISGMFSYWNFMLLPYVAILFILLIIQKNGIKHATLFILSMVFMCYLCFIQWIDLFNVIIFSSTKNSAGMQVLNYIIPIKDGIRFWIMNLGVLPIASMLGYYLSPKNIRRFVYPLLFVTASILCFGMIFNSGVIQKYIFPCVVVLNLYAAVFLVYIWSKNLIGKVIGVVFLLFLTSSGIMNFMVIKNDFQYPAINREMRKIVEWISASTPKQSVFLSYADIFDPVTLAGRKNYWGFYGLSSAIVDRSNLVKVFYENPQVIKKRKYERSLISYILVPKYKKDDFNYSVDINEIQRLFPVSYENSKIIIYSVQ